MTPRAHWPRRRRRGPKLARCAHSSHGICSVHGRVADLLHLERTCEAASTHIAQLELLLRSHAWAPVTPRVGGLLGRPERAERRRQWPTSSDLAAAAAGLPRRRWAPELCAGALPRCDLGLETGRADAMRCLERRVPVIMANAWELLPASQGWSVEALRERLSGQDRKCHVLKARQPTQKFTYYFRRLSDREMPQEALVAEPCNEELTMSFETFLQSVRGDPMNSYYLQTPLYSLVEKDGQHVGQVLHAGIKSEIDSATASPIWREIVSAAGCGPWTRTQLFVGPVGTLGAAHYDQYDNIFLQVRGSKSVILFDPLRGHRGLCPFPVHHPYDMRARIDLERPDYDTFPCARGLQGAGVVAELDPGDALFIPSHWWHHVEATAGAPDLCVSVNFWFDTVSSHLLHPPPGPLSSHLEVELARQVEYTVADAFGAGCVRDFVSALATDVRGDIRGEQRSCPEQLPARNFVLRSLAAWLGAPNVAKFIRDFLDAERWENLGRLCF